MTKKVSIEFTPFELETFYRVGNGEIGQFRTYEAKAHARLCNRLRAAHEGVTLTPCQAQQELDAQMAKQSGALQWTESILSELRELAQVCPDVESTDCYGRVMKLMGEPLSCSFGCHRFAYRGGICEKCWEEQHS